MTNKEKTHDTVERTISPEVQEAVKSVSDKLDSRAKDIFGDITSSDGYADSLGNRLNRINNSIDRMDKSFDSIDKNLNSINKNLAGMMDNFDSMDKNIKILQKTMLTKKEFRFFSGLIYSLLLVLFILIQFFNFL